MSSQSAEIIDLKAYRERRSAKPASNGSKPPAPSSPQGPIVPATFVMPAAFFYFWPTWVFTPAFPVGSDARGFAAT